MQISENFRIATDVIRSNKLRSFLTLLGIIIGVTSIIGMQALIEGIQLNMKKQMEQLGATVFQVQKMPVMGHDHDNSKFRNRKDIRVQDAIAIREHCSAVENVGPENWKSGRTVKYKDKKTSPTIMVAGGWPAFFPNNGYFIDAGRGFTEVDVQYNRPVAVIGQDVVEQLFPFQNPIGEEILMDGHQFQVIGTIEELGSSFGNNEDNRAIIPLGVFQKLYGKKRSINITISAKSPELFDLAQEQVIAILRTVRKVPPGKDNDFEIWSSQSLYNAFNKMTEKIRIGAIVIVSFSLLVAGIGIMNIMLVSIRERTREIGIRMALGAHRRDIRQQFLVEAVLLSAIGGIIGILFGIVIGMIASILIKVSISVPIFAIFLGFGSCAAIGILFGYYPANRASKSDPIECLRYE